MRVRFSAFQIERSHTGTAVAKVTLQYGGQTEIGTAAGPSSEVGDMRLSAEASLRALMKLTGDHEFDLVGVKHIKAFDSNLAIVSLTHRTDGMSYPLVGCYLAKEDIFRGAAIAVLNATNRILSVATQRMD